MSRVLRFLKWATRSERRTSKTRKCRFGLPPYHRRLICEALEVRSLLSGPTVGLIPNQIHGGCDLGTYSSGSGLLSKGNYTPGTLGNGVLFGGKSDEGGARVFAAVTAPAFTLSCPAAGSYTAGQPIPIQWTDANVPSGSTISLAYDTTTNWGNLTWIEVGGVSAANGSGSYNWNTASLTAGTYYIAGYLYTPSGTAVFSHLSTSFTVAAAAAAPTFTLSGPASGSYTIGQTIPIQWTDANVPSGSTISLAYDTTTNWGNPMWIEIGGVSAANGSASYSWNTASLTAGTYYIAGYLYTPSATAVFSHLTTSFTVTATALVAPSLTATAVSTTQINLAWNTVSGATGYLADELINGTWSQIGNFSSGVTSDAVTGLSPGTTYTFGVAAYNSAAASVLSCKSATTASAAVNNPTAATAYTPVSGSLFGPNGPSYLDVEQGAVGDCWLLASLAEVAARDPADIQNMFAADGTTVENGSTVSLYTVRFFNYAGAAHYVTVDTELPSGGGYYDHPANGVLWVALAEKAYAEANGAGIVSTSDPDQNSYAALNCGDPSWALQAITGKPASDFVINPNNIAAAWNEGELIVLGSSSTPASPYIVGDAQGTHAYAVVNYTASNNVPFEVYNPWGTDSSGWALGLFNGHQVYGLFTANATFLSQNFASQSIGSGTVPGMDDLNNGSKKVASILDANSSVWTTITHLPAELSERHTAPAQHE